MAITTVKIDTRADFEALLHSTVRIDSLTRYGDCRLTVRAWLPWLTRKVRLDSESIHKIWPQSKAIMEVMGNFSNGVIHERGIDLFKEAFNKTRVESSESFWMFDTGFFWHSELNGMRYEPTTCSVTINTKQRGSFTTTFSQVKENSYNVASFLMQTSDMALTGRKVIKALDLCGVMSLPRARPVAKRIPNAITDIMSITRVHRSSTEVDIIMKATTANEVEVCSCSLEALETAFPNIRQALLTTNEAHGCDEVIRASFLREWWREIPPEPNVKLLFSVGDSWADFLNFTPGPQREADGVTVHVWSDLISAALDGDPRIGLTFASDNPERPIYCTIAKGSAQYNLLGLDKIVAMLRALDINGPDAAGPFYRALCGQTTCKADLPIIDLDDHTFL